MYIYFYHFFLKRYTINNVGNLFLNQCYGAHSRIEYSKYKGLITTNA